MATGRQNILRQQRHLYDQMMDAILQMQYHQQDLNMSTCSYLFRNFARDYPYSMDHYQARIERARNNYSTFIKEHNLPWTPEK